MLSYIRSSVRRNPVTVTGRMLFLATTCSVFAVVDSTLAGLLSSLVWVLVPGFLLGLFYRPTLTVRVLAPRVVNAETECELILEVENVGMLDAYDLTFRFTNLIPGVVLLTDSISLEGIKQGQRLKLPVRVRAEKRGIYKLPPIQVASLFPLGLFRFLKTYTCDAELAIAPRMLMGLRISDEVQDRAEMHDGCGDNTLHTSFEYVGSREYQLGMQVRRWDFASWARTGTPTLRKFSEGEELKVALIADTFRLRSEDLLLERILSYSAGVISELMDHRGIGVELFTPHRVVTAPTPSEDLQRALAAENGTESVIHWQEVLQEALSRTSSGTTIVLLLRDDSIDASLIATDTRTERNIVVRTITTSRAG